MIPVNDSPSKNEIAKKQQLKNKIEFVKQDFLSKIKMGIEEKQAFEDAINSHLKKELKEDIFEKENSDNNNEKKLFLGSKLCKNIKPGKILDYLSAIETVVSFADTLITVFKKDKE